MPHKILKIFSKNLQNTLLALRHDLHRHPELSGEEFKTSRRLYLELEKLHPAELMKVVATGVYARFRGTNPSAPTVAIRGDIDALPVTENTGLLFCSENVGVMHACGHDVHATWAIGAAALLAEKPACGDVVVILQPAEEIGQGARAILNSGVLKTVSAIFGAHVDLRLEVGQVVAQEGPLAASSDMFDIELIGQGAHGARPHEAKDPIVAAASLILALQTLVSRKLNPAKAGVVSIGSIHAGTAANIIPDTAILTGTIRATESQTRSLLKQGVQEIAQSHAESFGLKAVVNISSGTPPIVNPPEIVAWAKQAVKSTLGKEALVALDTLNMAGEDFALYMEEIPGCFLRIGAREAGGEIVPAHSPKFFAADNSIFVGAAVLAEMVRFATTSLFHHSVQVTDQ